MLFDPTIATRVPAPTPIARSATTAASISRRTSVAGRIVLPPSASASTKRTGRRRLPVGTGPARGRCGRTDAGSRERSRVPAGSAGSRASREPSDRALRRCGPAGSDDAPGSTALSSRTVRPPTRSPIGRNTGDGSRTPRCFRAHRRAKREDVAGGGQLIGGCREVERHPHGARVERQADDRVRDVVDRHDVDAKVASRLERSGACPTGTAAVACRTC